MTDLSGSIEATMQADSPLSATGPSLMREGLEETKQAFRRRQQRLLADFLASDLTLALPSAALPKVSIVVVTCNQAELTFACLTAVEEHATASMELLIVDNGSSDDTLRLLGRLRGARIIGNVENRGYLLAVCQATAEARGEHILLLNNDAFLRKGSLQAAIATLEGDPSIGAVGGALVNMDGKLQEAGSIIWRDGSHGHHGAGCDPAAPKFQLRRDVDYCSGAFLLFRRSVWNQLGGFDAGFAPGYYEDTDFCMRLREAGLRVVYEPCAIVDHFQYGSAVNIAAAKAQVLKNRARFIEKHAAALQRQPARP